MAKHGYESTTVAELRQMLITDRSYKEEDILDKTKLQLVDLILEIPANNETDDLLDEAVEIQEEVIDTSIIDDTPTPQSENWTSYVLTLLRKDELFDGRPTVDGLRRITEVIVGQIVNREVVFLSPPNKDNNMTSTITLRISIQILQDNYWGNHNGIITEEDVGDAGLYNADPPFDKYPSSLASTRAEGRCLRKILRLKIVTSEEISQKAEQSTSLENTTSTSDEWIPSDKISFEQKNVITLLCKQTNINVNDIINSGKEKYNSIDDISKDTGQKIIQYLNKLRQGQVDKPTGIGEFKE
jgi:hypothetical protein